MDTIDIAFEKIEYRLESVPDEHIIIPRIYAQKAEDFLAVVSYNPGGIVKKPYKNEYAKDPQIISGIADCIKPSNYGYINHYFDKLALTIISYENNKRIHLNPDKKERKEALALDRKIRYMHLLLNNGLLKK